MVQNTSSKSTESGLELDRMEIPTPDATKLSPRPPSGPDQSSPDQSSSAVTEKSKYRKRQFWIIFAAILTTLVLLTVLGNVFKREELSINLMSEEKTTYVSENLLRVGPVTATMSNNDIIRLSVDIDCRKGSLKKKLSGKEPQIRNEIVSILTNPETEHLLKSQQYEVIRAEIKSKLANLTNNDIGEIYFAEILTY